MAEPSVSLTESKKSHDEMNAFILAGGLATRLRPITNDIPKALVPVLGKPFLYYQLEFLKSQNVKNVVLLIGYQADKIVQEFGDGKKLGLMIEYQVESTPLGTGGALIKARHLLEENTLILNGDTYFEFDLQKLVYFHQEKKSEFTLGVVTKKNAGQDYGAISLDSKGRVLSFSEKTENGQFLSAGCYVVSKKLMDQYTSAEGPISLEHHLIPSWLEQRSAIFGFEFQGNQTFYDVGTPERLKVFEEYLNKKKSYAH